MREKTLVVRTELTVQSLITTLVKGNIHIFNILVCHNTG